MRNTPTRILTLAVILSTTQLHSQGMDVNVFFTADSTLHGSLVSVGDSSVIFRFPEYQWDQRSQEFDVTRISAIAFTRTMPGGASTFAKVAATTCGVIVGAVAGAAIGDATTGQADAFQPRWGVIGATLLGGVVGGYLGTEIVNPSVSEEIRLDPNNPEHRDSLRVFLLTR